LANEIHLKVVTPIKLLVDEQVDEVVAPGETGEFGVLPGHEPFVTTLQDGELRYKKGGVERTLTLEGGLADVREDNVSILADRAVED
jgi:F-type H+-transporting ATPase subunit epsilon